jgi:sulfur carrier protein
MTMIEIVVNGESKAVARLTDVASALQSWGYECGGIALAVNGEFVARSEYGARVLQAGDSVEVVAPVQGG